MSSPQNPEGAGTDTDLNAGATFTGEQIDLNGWAAFVVTIITNVSSAVDGLAIQFRETEDETWHTTDTFSIPADSIKTYTFQPILRFARVVYTNGAGATTGLHIHVQVRADAVKASSHRLADPITAEDDAELVKAVLEDRHGHPVERGDPAAPRGLGIRRHDRGHELLDHGGANATPFGIDLHDVSFYTGLTLAITGANANATVIYE